MPLPYDLKSELFQAILGKVKNCRPTLEVFYKRWSGKAGGFQDWLKVQVVGAIPEDMASVSTGSAGGRGRTGRSFPDLILSFTSGQVVKVELKAMTNWNPAGGDPWDKHLGRVLIFLCAGTA